jgi:hypothetical protein
VIIADPAVPRKNVAREGTSSNRHGRPRYRPIVEERDMRHAKTLDWLAARLVLVGPWLAPRWTIGPPRRRHKRRRRDLP